MPSNRYPFIARETWSILFVICCLAIIAQFWLGAFAFIFLLVIFFIAIYLFRDPNRVIPSQPLAVVSPVHGIVTLVEDVEEARLQNKTIRVQITMRFHDIYSFRSPIEGKVMEQCCSQPNEDKTRRHFDFYIKADEGDIIVTSIRPKDLVRKFHMYLHSGDRVGQGQRCGYFYFGGVVDVYIPFDSKVQVEVGQYVESGSTVLAQIIRSQAASAIQDNNGS